MNKSINFKQIFCFSLVLLATSSSFSQKMYVSANFGYGLGMSEAKVAERIVMTGSSPIYAFESINGSFGKGINFGGALGYKFMPNLGIEVGISYLKSAKITWEDIEAYSKTQVTLSANMLRIMPSLVYTMGTGKFQPYTKAGAVMANGTITRLESENYYSITNGIATRKILTKGGLNWGIQEAVGLTFKANEHFAVFAEINNINMSYAPQKASLVEATYQGEDKLSTFSTYQKETIYVKTTPIYDPNDTANPRKEIRTKMPFGSVGLNMGVKVGF